MNRIDQAMQAVSRSQFLPPGVRARSRVDVPLSIGFGQTNSQPSTVRLMLKLLDPQQGEKILDVGSGSGWTTALLATLVGSKGVVYAVEKVPQLVRFGAQNCKRASVQNVHFFQAGKEYGLPQFAPYDRILVSAAATQLPGTLLGQLRAGGRMVIPIQSSIHMVDKIDDGTFKDAEYPGFLFVPLIP
jgi:protein-L-isoaspartate(D-aspartate) O-methyltransferase